MSEDKHTEDTAPEGDIQASTPTGDQSGVAAGSTAAVDSPEARIAELERQLAAERDAATDYMQRWQRAAADFSNFKRRTQQEQEQREQLLGAQALMPVLHALDSFERAFATLPDSLRSYGWIEGIALVDAQLRHALEAQGITEVAAEPGEPFDPTRHQAIGEIATDEHPTGHIAVLVQRGYQVASLLMRPALVQVARAPEPTEAAESSNASATARAAETTETATAESADTQPSGPAP